MNSASMIAEAGTPAAPPPRISSCVALAALAALTPRAHATVMTVTLAEPTFANFVSAPSLTGAISVGPQAFGTYTVNQVAGQDQSDLAIPGILNAQSLNISSAASGVLTVTVHSSSLIGTGSAISTSSFAVNALNGGITSIDEATFVNGVQVATHTFSAIGTNVQILPVTGLTGTFTADDVFTIHATGGTGNANLTIDLSGTPVPEPVSLALLGVGVLGLGVVRTRRRR